ncbi:hypothetical protein D9M69_728290 [compost metagenome]
MNQITENRMTAANFMRSANAPTISAPVMPANVDWNATNTYSGRLMPSLKVADNVSMVTPFRNSLSRLPIHWPSPENARL